MGCDIHLYVEERVDNIWRPTQFAFKNPYYRPDEESPPEWAASEYVTQLDDPYGEGGLYDTVYGGRNYSLFAILANVRNGRGFAGCDTGDGFRPISMPRGLPTDVSPEVQAESDNWGLDGHSHSWLALPELESYDWDQVTKHRGWVDPEGYMEFAEVGKPSSYSGGVVGGNVRHVSNKDMKKLIDLGVITRQKHGLEEFGYFTQVEWEEPYRESAGYFLETIMPQLRELAKTVDGVRIVFWFDN